MTDQEKIFVKIIEKTNFELLEERSKNNKKDKVKMFLNSIKTANVIFAIKRILGLKKNNNNERNFEDVIYTLQSDENKKIAVYTCITGEYDNVCEPLIKESNCDYYLFTNNEKIKSMNWQIKEIPDNIKKLDNNILINRYIKMHPYELFPQYDYCIYIDGNITIVSTISEFTNRISKNTGLAFHTHYNKDCTYDEIKTCEIVGKGNVKKLKEQEKKYRKEKFPEHYGLFECNVIISQISNKKGENILNKWWDEFKNSSSMRDQICLPYSLWKSGYKCSDIGIIDKNVFLNPKIRINKHL